MQTINRIGMVSKMSSSRRDRVFLDIIEGLNEDIAEFAKSQSFQEWLMHKHKELYFELLDEYWKDIGEINDR